MACRISLLGFVTVSDRQSMTRADITEGVVSTIFYYLFLIRHSKRSRSDERRTLLFFIDETQEKQPHTTHISSKHHRIKIKMATTGGGDTQQQQQQQKQQHTTPQHKQTVLDLGKYIDKGVRVKLSGGREVEGILKGFDQLLNLVLDETKEYLRDVDDPLRITDETRNLGLIVTRGTSVMVVSPLDGLKEIENPFAVAEEY
jgi:U6 snRNA-associated Sm-like protein LSm7